MKPHYRIVSDNFAGYEVQIWRWWFPFWVMPRCNTHMTIEAAEDYARRMAKGKCVKYLGTLDDKE